MVKSFKIAINLKLVLHELGIQTDNILRHAALPADLFARESISLSEEEFFRLWGGIEEEVNDFSVFLDMGRGISVEAFSPELFAALCSPNLNYAAERMSRYKQLVGPFSLEATIEPEETILTIDSIRPGILPLSLAMAESAFLVEFARQATRTNLRPIRITTVEKIRLATPFEQFFGAQIKQGPKYTVVFSAVDAQRPFLTANAEMWRFLEPVLSKRLSDLDQTASYSERVKATLYELLPSGRGTIDEVSSTLGVSTRSLQRHLMQEESNFKQILRETREELARYYLGQSTMTVEEVAFLLGYNEANSFFRAFRSWTGQTPKKLRSSLS